MNNKRKSFWDLRSPALRPLWVRVAIVVVCACWTIVEIMLGEVFWTMIFGASAVFLYVRLLLRYDQKPDP